MNLVREAVSYGGGSSVDIPDAEIESMLRYVRTRPRGFRWQEEDFKGNWGITVLFRQLGQEKEHWLNHVAVALTSWPWEKAPFGNNCHCEIIMEPEKGRLVRLATMKKYRLKDDRSGKDEWLPGKVFVSDFNEVAFKDYMGFHLPSTRAMQLRLWCFFMKNLEAEFNNPGYYIKALSPWSVGAAHYRPEDHDVSDPEPPKQKFTYFCSQLIVIALQAAAYELVRVNPGLADQPDARKYWATAVLKVRATDTDPNWLFKFLHGMRDATPVSQPHGKLSLES